MLTTCNSATLLVKTPRVSTVLMVPPMVAVYTVRFKPESMLAGGRSRTCGEMVRDCQLVTTLVVNDVHTDNVCDCGLDC